MPQALAKALIAYFESSTEGILDNNGTLADGLGQRAGLAAAGGRSGPGQSRHGHCAARGWPA